MPTSYTELERMYNSLSIEHDQLKSKWEMRGQLLLQGGNIIDELNRIIDLKNKQIDLMKDHIAKLELTISK
jgi:hypothetical protein